MRHLLDNNLSPRLAPVLHERGFDVVHVRDLGLQSAPDEQVLAEARRDRRVLVSADTDFGVLLARSGSVAPSVVLLRRGSGRHHQNLADLLVDNLPALQTDLQAGAVVVITDTSIRVRPLPLLPAEPRP